MKIIPAHLYPTESKAEKRIFTKLKECFVNDNKYVAFHSLNLTVHNEKRFGEADFVVICQYGLFVFEVKGGGVGFNDEGWYSIDKNNQTHKIQDPFKQSQGALHAIEKKIKDSHKFDTLHIPIGHGVIFPDIEFKQAGGEWEAQMVCDKQKFKNFESFLSKFFRYWFNENKKKIYRIECLSIEKIQEIAKYLRPYFEVIETLQNILEGSSQRAFKLTEEQYEYLDAVEANNRVLCFGGAGTGKTFLAAELARRIANEDKKIVVICKSEWLCNYLRKKIVNEFVSVSTIDSIKVTMRREGIEKYAALIVDEGQDVFNLQDMDILDEILDNELENGEWYIFHDSNNQAFKEIDKEVLELLESYSPTRVPLNKNCRNTKHIVKYINDLLSVDMGRKEVAEGPEVRELYASEICISEVLDDLLDDGVIAKNITILSPQEYRHSSIARLPESKQNRITPLDSYSIRNFPVENISYAEIKNFKGLENEVIVLVDMPQLNSEKEMQTHTEYYVAMSRAKGLLVVLWSNNL